MLINYQAHLSRNVSHARKTDVVTVYTLRLTLIIVISFTNDQNYVKSELIYDRYIALHDVKFNDGC